MPLQIACPNCEKKYQVAEHLAGKRVKCQQCATPFSVDLPPVSPLDPLAELAAMPAAAGPPGAPARALARPAQASAPAPAGPSDSTMRLVCAGMVGLGFVLLVATFVMDRTMGAIYLAPLALAPLSIILGVAGVVSPNVVRAAGKYGGHLPWQYKATAWGLMGVCLLATLLLVLWAATSGYGPG